MTNETRAPKPEMKGAGYVLYRCATCGRLMHPAEAVIVGARSYHPTHAPEDNDGR